MTLFRSLRHRPFALLWSGQTISRLGDSLFRVALAWWVLRATGSASAMGLVLVFSFAPMIVFVLIGGVAVDRLPRLWVMVVADLSSGAAVALIAVLAYQNRLELWHIYAASVLFGLMEAFFFPAYGVVVPELTPPESLPSANSLTSLSQQLAGIVGPALGAWVVAVYGAPAAFAFNAASFFVAAACLLPLLRRRGTTAPRIVEKTNAWRELREGVALVWNQPWLWITIAVFSLINVTLNAPRAVSLPFLVERNLHADVGALGLLFSSASVGAVAGALWLGRLPRIRRRGPLAYGATVLAGLASVALGLVPIVAVAVAASFVGGLCISIFSLIWTNTLQEMVPREKLGRVLSIDSLGSYALLPLGFGLAGLATDWVGAPLVFALGGGATALLALAGWLHPAIRSLD